MGTKEPQNRGNRDVFKVEANQRNAYRADGARARLDMHASLPRAVECAISAGAYISFGQSTDGGAILIRILDGADKLSVYCHSDVEIVEALEAITARYGMMGVPPVRIETRGNP
jgi:adenylate cyclase